MRLEIEITNVKPRSLNQYTKIVSRGKFTSKYKPKETQEFESKVNSALNAYKAKFTKLNNYHKPSEHYFCVDYIFYMPVLVKKKDRISKTSMDTDNLIKPVQDLIFKRLNADDSEVISVSATKVHSDNYSIRATIRVCNLKDIL